MAEREDLEFIERIAEPLRERETVEPAFEARLLSAVRAASARGDAPWAGARTTGGHSRRRWRWLTAPRRVAISPLGGFALAAGFAAAVAATTLAVSGERERPARATAAAAGRAGATDERSRRVVHFAIAAPAAQAVTLVGDFNGWDATTTPMTKGVVDGLWMVAIPLAAGSYQYAFVIDGTAWTSDPAAPISVDDEFGTPSSIVQVTQGTI